MPIVAAFIQLVAFGAIAIDMTSPAASVVLFFMALPTLALHTAAWAAARFLSLPWTVVATVVLNAAVAAAGLAFWVVRSGEGAVPPQRAVTNALVFFLTGLAASALVVGWVRYTARRRAQGRAA